MIKKAICILVAAFFLSLGLKAAVRAQGYYTKSKATSAEPSEEEAGEEQDILAQAQLKNQEKTNQQILHKLDLILGNQEKILKELEIVKVRASKK